MDSSEDSDHSVPDDELIADKEPPSKWAGDHDPALAARPHPLTFEGEMKMLGDHARDLNARSWNSSGLLSKQTLFTLIILSAILVILLVAVVSV